MFIFKYIIHKLGFAVVIKRKRPIDFRCKTNRDRGYYWVRTDYTWHVGFWDGGGFHLIHTELEYNDYDFDEIIEVQIKLNK